MLTAIRVRGVLRMWAPALPSHLTQALAEPIKGQTVYVQPVPQQDPGGKVSPRPQLGTLHQPYTSVPQVSRPCLPHRPTQARQKCLEIQHPALVPGSATEGEFD